MIKVMFVCLGNICRSPMAEAVFRNLIKNEGIDHLFEVDSSGLGGWHEGEDPHKGTKEILRRNQISYEGIKARQIHTKDIEQFNYIIAMDEDNIKVIQSLNTHNPHAYIGRLLDFVDDENDKNVPDPYYTGNFEYVYSLVHKGCTKLLEKIKQDHNIV